MTTNDVQASPRFHNFSHMQPARAVPELAPSALRTSVTPAERVAQMVAMLVLFVAVLLAASVVAGSKGAFPLPSWSPMGQQQDRDQQLLDDMQRDNA